MSASARYRQLAGTAITLVLIGLWFVALRPVSLGGPATYVVIRGDSMEPGYHNGDLVIMQVAGHYEIDDIVAYRVPEGELGSGHVVIHRITGGDPVGGYLLRGDNNQSLDPWMPRSEDIVGSAWIRIPGFGRLLVLVHQPAVAGALAAALVVALIAARATPPRRVPSRAGAGPTPAR